MSAPRDSDVHHPDTPSQDAVVAAALRRAADASGDARAIFDAVRDPAGKLVDLRILYANAAYWALAGFDPVTSLGRTISVLAPGIDWTDGLAARLFDAMDFGGAHADNGVRVRPQTGPSAGQDRVFDVEFAGSADVLSARFHDVTDDVAHVSQQVAEARRTAAVARFLAAAVDPAIGRTAFLGFLADELADTIGNLCVIVEQDSAGSVLVTAVSGGPGDVAMRMSAARLGPIPLPEPYRDAFLAGATVLHSPIGAEIREQVIGALRWLGLPDELSNLVNSTISAAVRRSGRPIARIHLVRFGDDPAMTRDDVATVEAIAATAAVVLERRMMEDHLEASRARFEAVFELAPISMVAVASDRAIRFNRRALELYGRDRAEMTRLSFEPEAPWIPADQRERWEEMRRRVTAGERVEGERLAIIRPNGERREIEGSSIQIVTAAGVPSGVVTVLMDLTDQLSLEAQFRHAQKMEALGRLAGGIAHDFNNVLMAIQGYAKLVARDARAGAPVDVTHADEVVSATGRAIQLTARLTTFARREATLLEPVDVAQVVRDLLPLIKGLTPESIEIVTRLNAAPSVKLDRSEFEQALVNLVVNGIDAMPTAGRLTIEVGAVDGDIANVPSAPGEPSVRHVLVTISDTGTGMDDATRSRIFEPFYTTKDASKGTGLGLSMVFAAVQRIGGRIWVYSEMGRGTTFSVHLPAAPSVDPIAFVDIPAMVRSMEGSESILLVEDDATLRQLLLIILGGAGYSVSVAARPSEALELAAGRRFDLLVSDVVMPEMMGDAVAAKLRESQPDLRVVLMSGYTASTVGFELGPLDSFVHKPLRPSEVLQVVRDALDRVVPG